MAPAELWRSVLGALENERSLDLQFRANSTSLRDDEKVPNYKVMKQLALRNRLGVLYRPFILVGLVMIPAAAVVDWVYALLASLLPADPRQATLHIVATTPVNIGLIESALSTEPGFRDQRVDHDLLSRRRLSAEIGLWNVAFCIVSHVRLFLHILRFGAERRIDLIFHSRDALVLLMLACYARSRPDHRFATEDHYQRWAYLLSQHSPNLSVVQHGALDPNIPFVHDFGAIRTLYLRDQRSRADFEKYYRVGEGKLFSPVRTFKKNPFSEFGIFLASSFPYIDAEIEMVRMIKARHNIPVILKFHPAHHYDQRKQVLSALADYICADDEHPACRLFVSHNSFMENDYVACGVPTISMERLGGAAASAQAISGYLASAGSAPT
jgi:hypothetical protein